MHEVPGKCSPLGPFCLCHMSLVVSALLDIVSGAAACTTILTRFVYHLQADIAALKAELTGHPALAALPFFSTNDVISALAWLLACDMRSRARPGQKAAGHRSTAMMMVEMTQRGLPAGLIPQGYSGNLTAAVAATAVSDGSNCSLPDERQHLLSSLASAVRACRTVLLAISQPGWALETLVAEAALCRAGGFAALVAKVAAADMDTRMTNWATFDNQLDFGTGGKAHITGYERMGGMNICCVVKNIDGSGVGIRMESSLEGLDRALASPLLPALAPKASISQALQSQIASAGRADLDPGKTTQRICWAAPQTTMHAH